MGLIKKGNLEKMPSKRFGHCDYFRAWRLLR